MRNAVGERVRESRALFATLVGRLERRARRDLLIRGAATGSFVRSSARCGRLAPCRERPPSFRGTSAGCRPGRGRVRRGTCRGAPAPRRPPSPPHPRRQGPRQPRAHEYGARARRFRRIGDFRGGRDRGCGAASGPDRSEEILGRLKVPLAPFAALAALLTAAGLLFPVNLRALFPRRVDPSSELAQIGEDLRNRGLRLAEEARTRDLGRSLELSQQLAQLGNDLAARRIQRRMRWTGCPSWRLVWPRSTSCGCRRRSPPRPPDKLAARRRAEALRPGCWR